MEMACDARALFNVNDDLSTEGRGRMLGRRDSGTTNDDDTDDADDDDDAGDGNEMRESQQREPVEADNSMAEVCFSDLHGCVYYC